MTNEELKKKIKSAFTNIAPDNFQEILSDSKQQKGSVVNMTTNRKNNFKKLAAVAAAFVILVAGFSFFALNQGKNNVSASVLIDVNPSVNIQLDKNEKVIDVVSFNKDGDKIIGSMEFKGADLTVTINALIGSMLRNGYLSDITNSLLVTVEGDNHERNAELQKRVEDEIAEVLKGGNFEAAILKQEIDDNDDTLEDFAEKNGISEGKAKLVHALAKELPHHTPEELAKLSINELNILAEKSLKIEAKGEASKKQYIGEDKACEIAFEKAGITAKQAQNLFMKMETDDGIMVYEIDFSVNGYEYEVEINAQNGIILDFDKEPIDNEHTVTIKPSAENKENNTDIIGKQEAKTIALKKAGVLADKISGYICELDSDDGKKVYEIEFNAGKYEYDVEVNAKNGKVIHFDKELTDKYSDNDDDDHKKPAQSKPKPTTTVKAENYISKAKAKSIAINKAGVSSDKITAYKCEFDKDDGVAVYDIEFNYGKYEYSVEINAKTGAVTDFEKEIDNDAA